jgi:hypothetical protein
MNAPTFGRPAERQFASEEEWLDYEDSRGPLAMQPEHLPCHACSREAGVRVEDWNDESKLIWQPVVKLGPVCEPLRDPTQSYVLACGHTII